MTPQETDDLAKAEYLNASDWWATQQGEASYADWSLGCALPFGISSAALDAILADPEAFSEAARDSWLAARS